MRSLVCICRCIFHNSIHSAYGDQYAIIIQWQQRIINDNLFILIPIWINDEKEKNVTWIDEILEFCLLIHANISLLSIYVYLFTSRNTGFSIDLYLYVLLWSVMRDVWTAWQQRAASNMKFLWILYIKWIISNKYRNFTFQLINFDFLKYKWRDDSWRVYVRLVRCCLLKCWRLEFTTPKIDPSCSYLFLALGSS